MTDSLRCGIGFPCEPKEHWKIRSFLWKVTYKYMCNEILMDFPHLCVCLHEDHMDGELFPRPGSKRPITASSRQWRLGTWG